MLGEPKKLSIERILEINEAVVLIADNTLIDTKTSYAVGRLGDACKAPQKKFTKIDDDKKKALREKQRELQKSLIGKSDDDKRLIVMEIEVLQEKYREEVKEALEMQEELHVPTLKLSQFSAKEEIKSKEKLKGNKEEKEIEVTIKAGQSLVPIRFYALMGDLIEDDMSK